MQSGRKDTLEERYAIKFCFKLGKNTTETYGMLQTAFGASCMNRASVFEWHKRFNEGRKSVRDDERCGRSKEVRTPELIGQIKDFMNKDRRVSIETIIAQFDVSVGTVHTIIREELKIRKICAKFVPRVFREDQKERSFHESREMVELINSDPAVLDVLVTCNESWIYCYDPETKKQSSQWKHDGSPRPRKARQRKSNHKLLMIPFFLQHWYYLHALGSHWTDSQQGILCWGFKGVQEEISSEEACTLQIWSVAFPPGQCTSPHLHPCHRLFDQDGHQDSFSPSLWHLIIPQAQGKTWRLSLWDNWGDERGCNEGHWHVHTRGLPWGLPDVVGTVQQVHCSRRRLLRRGLEFHVCTINKMETYLMTLVLRPSATVGL